MDLELKLDRQRATSLVQAIGVLVLMAGIGGALSQATRGDLYPSLRAAGQAMLVALVGFSVIGAVIAIAHMLTRHRPVEQGDGDDFVQTAPRTLTRLPDGWTRAEYVHYMRAVLDDDSDVGLNQRDASDYGHSRDKLNALVEWLVQRGWWEYTNGVDNRHGGRWIVDSDVILGDE